MRERMIGSAAKVYISREKTDMRKSINGLAQVVQESFKLNAFTSAIFVFCNGDKNKIKILQWDKDGFSLYYKRREKGRFWWPSFEDKTGAITISKSDLNRLLDGLLMEQFVPHKSYIVV